VRRWRGYQEVPDDWGRSAVTIGVFDGVHKGHQRLIGYVVKRAADLGVRSVVITFDPHPAEVLGCGSPPAVLTEPAAKAELIEALGVDALCVVPFTPRFARLTGEEFVRAALIDRLRAALVVVGGDFRFGRDAVGDVALLRDLGREGDFLVDRAELLRESQTVISSTFVRQRVAAGDVQAAGAALGRPHRIAGVVVSGDGRGRSIGFPTANLSTEPGLAIPAAGVYAGWLIRGEDRLPAAISIGTNPTFAGAELRVEAHVLDFVGDLYGDLVTLEFVTRLREMRPYPTVAGLIEQIGKDVIMTRTVLASARGEIR
jgi:riboflavin kinase/FMN adenylyltransferase